MLKSIYDVGNYVLVFEPTDDTKVEQDVPVSIYVIEVETDVSRSVGFTELETIGVSGSIAATEIEVSGGTGLIDVTDVETDVPGSMNITKVETTHVPSSKDVIELEPTGVPGSTEVETNTARERERDSE